AGLIEPAIEIRGVPYFDFQRIATARTLCNLTDAGVSTAQIRSGLERLRTWMAEPEEPLQQLSVLERHGTFLVRLESGLVEPSGQMWFDFGEDQAVIAAQPMTADEWFQRGCEHEEDGELQDAMHAYRQALAVGGLDPDICFNLANVLYAVGQRVAAIERWRTAVEIDPDYAEAWNNLGVALGEAGRMGEARQALATAIRLDFASARWNMRWLTKCGG
ncbi:MAG TPA: tetratricopeptide repeat protein, partial [Gemmataceae bacterium]|nr:tetratricopeptide repeat protein [Gemmataceae bacterium]